MALVRLGWAAQNSLPASPALASALRSLAGSHPEAVLSSIAKWFGNYDPPMAGINALLALAFTSAGAALLCRRAEPVSGQPGFRDNLVGYFQRSLSQPSSYEATIAVFGALEPELGKNPMSRLRPGFPDMDSFWGQAFGVAIRGNDPDRETDAALPEALARPDTGAVVYTPTKPATPNLSADAETDLGAYAG